VPGSLLRCSATLAAGATALAGACAYAQAPASHEDPCGPAPAVAAPFGANTNRTGLVDLHFFNAHGATVTYFECVAGHAYRLGERAVATGAITSMWGATTWRCGRLTRHFAATATLPDGSFVRGVSSVRTRSCAHRFVLHAPHRITRGQRASVRVVDGWGLGGISTRLCFVSPRAHRDCRTVAFAAATSAARRRWRPMTRGLWRVELQVRHYRVRAWIAVGVRQAAPTTPPPTVLATGDSTMQGVESFLADELGEEARVVSDVRPGFAISREEDGWTAVATAQVARLRPRTTVISIGAAEGFPMNAADGAAHDCCDEAWVDTYARRVRKAMVIYRRRGRGRVVYLTVVAPRDPARVTIVDAVNRAIVRAAEGLAGVRVLRMDLLFSPHGYQEVLHYRGRDVRVREPDGVHLNAAGTAIEAREAAQAVRGAWVTAAVTAGGPDGGTPRRSGG
jgi:hypothetical protein